MIKTVEGDQVIVSMERKDIIQGSQKMLALGQGVRAKLGKDADGKTVVEAFYFDRNRYSEEKIDKWMAKHKDKVMESMHYVQMQAPAGSFEDTAARIQMAVDDSERFSGMPIRVEFVFPDKVCVCNVSNGDMYEMEYENMGTEIKLSDPVKMKLEMVKEKIREFNAKVARFNEPNAIIKDEKISLRFKEGTFDLKDKKVVVVLIEAGVNYNKKRYYPKKTIQEAAPLFAGLKMYLDHPTEQEEAQKPERSIREWLSTIEESWYEDGMALGRVHIHSPWLLENMADEVFRREIATSINASGRMHIGEIDGHQMQIMDSIVDPRSVDWVTEAGARGRVLQLQESQRIEKEKTEIKNMLTVKELKETNKALYDQVAAEIREAMKGETEAKIQEAVTKAVEKALNDEKEKATKAEKLADRKAKITETVAGSKLPEKARARFVENFIRENAEVKDEELDAKLKEAVITEIKYLNEMGAGIKIDVDPGKVAATGAIEEATAGIIEAAGYKK